MTFAAAVLLLMAQFSPGPKQYVTLIPPSEPLKARAGTVVEAPVAFAVERGYHINSHKPTEEFMLPTRMEWTAPGLKHIVDTYPQPELKSFPFAPNKKLSVYEGVQTLKAKFVVPAGSKAGTITVEGRMRYQACDNAACYPPRYAGVKFSVEVK